MESEFARDHHHQARVASHVPGRLRVKLGPASRDAGVLDGIARRLKSHDGIHHVSVNPPSGSVTVHYDSQRHHERGVVAMFEDCECIFVNLESMKESPALEANPGFLAAVDDLNARLSAAIGIPLDLKILLPVSFLGAGIWSIARRGLMVEALPGWLFLWLALDSFVKLHPSTAPAAQRVSTDRAPASSRGS